jgi:hypothetical protein
LEEEEGDHGEHGEKGEQVPAANQPLAIHTLPNVAQTNMVIAFPVTKPQEI